MGLKTTVQKPSQLIELLQELYPQSPRSRIKKLLQNKHIVCNGKIVTRHSFELKQGDQIEVISDMNRTSQLKTPFPVLYNDQDIIIVDKPAGISTSSIDNSPSVNVIMSQYLKSQSKVRVKAYVVHRIDKEVSGVLMFAKSEQTMDLLKDNWKGVKKLYYALVEGRPSTPEGIIKSLLVEGENFKVHSTQVPTDKAKLAITHYRTIRQVDQYTLLEVELETGRKNQIRVHLSDIGCPIVGDRKYGASADFIRRVRLHAFYLRFLHPYKKEVITIESPMPKGFLVIRDKDENYK